MANQEHPTVAFIISLIGGVLMLMNGIVFFFVGLTGYVGRYHESLGFIRPGVALIGIWGIIAAIVVISSSIMLNREPGRHAVWGVLVLVFALLAYAAGGGFVIGGILGVIGGIWAIVWKPPEPQMTVPAPPPPSPPPE